MLCSRKVPDAKKFMDKREVRGRGAGSDRESRFSIEIFCPKCQKISHGKPSVLCSRKLPVAKKFLDKRCGGVVMRRFSVGNFLPHSSEKIRRENILCCFRKNSSSKKVYGYEGGREYQVFPSKNF